ncbi:major facilitator superfamily transporter [Sphaerosporella brunnea]|uniref:Major facilitator superfamily transporter n=1 Tax=Sphaerosporella brunnea TaxID=1250544 RepID=A0A5J5EX14_9PEZI|nr:major facilitator superfamily transporter [Sphaerosporella brunnea]
MPVGLEEEDAELEAKVEQVYRKLDRRILPALWTLYFLCAAIRSNVSLSLTMNTSSGHSLKQTLHLTGKQVSTGVALFYVCYVVFDAPANLLMTRLSPQVWMARIVIGVAIIGACHAALSAAWNFYLLRLLLGIVIAGMWPGMAYYLTLFYPPELTGKRIGQYYTAAQVSAAVVGLVSAGFQLMDGMGGLTGAQWMFLLYGLVTFVVGVALLWWLPDRPSPPAAAAAEGTATPARWWHKLKPHSAPALRGGDARVHYADLTRVYHVPPWGLRDLWRVIQDWRLWPLTLMYFGVVGIGIGVQIFATLIISSILPHVSSIQLSLLYAPIWICDLIAILIFTPLSDRFNNYRPLFFILPVCVQIAGLLVTTFAGGGGWQRYAGLLIVGFGLGPTVPTVMAWTSETFQPRHGEVGVAAATALVSGLGNLGSVTTTYALYTGWERDAQPGPHQYRLSNLAMVGILGMSMISAVGMWVAVSIVDGGKKKGGEIRRAMDGAARRAQRGQRGFDGMFGRRRK